MNNIANNIEPKSRSLKDLLRERKYQVKYFQREYKWQKNHIEDLLIDLERSFLSNFKVDHTKDDIPDYGSYYMGPIVLYKEKASFVIVDGQQRLTSFTLLLIYLHHLQKEVFIGNPGNILKLNEYIFSKPYEKATFNLEIPQREHILKSLYELNNAGDQIFINDEIPRDESSQNILDRYLDIVSLIPKILKSDAVLPKFITWLVEKVMFIEILAQSSDSAYTIFETMNDRGLHLTQAELLKSYLISNVRDEDKIKELDIIWKRKISQLRKDDNKDDQDFFKSWLNAKYAQRDEENGDKNDDFEKISSRYSNWVQDNARRLLYLDQNNPDTFYYFVNSDFNFYSNIYLEILAHENAVSDNLLKLISFKGVSQSLSYPFMLASIQKIDNDSEIKSKIELTAIFLDSYAIYRLLLSIPITHSSIRYNIYTKILNIRNKDFGPLQNILKGEIDTYKAQFLREIEYVPFDNSYSKYLLARLYKAKNDSDKILFEDLFYQRKKDSFILYQFFTPKDVGEAIHKIPMGLQDIFRENLCTYCILPKSEVSEYEEFPLQKRIQKLINKKYIFEFISTSDYDLNNLMDFFIKRNKRLKELIISNWKL